MDYLHIQGDIPANLVDGAYISIDRTTPLKIYQLGFQPAKSIPEIPRWFLRKYINPSSILLEPFAGSGTTIIESIQHGSLVYWLDYHPLSRLICQVKTMEFSCQEVAVETAELLQKANSQKKAPPVTVDFANKDFWFQKPVQEGLQLLREYISKTSVAIQPVLWLAFSATVRKTSDMNDGMLLAAKRPHIEKIPQRTRQDVFYYFQQYAQKTLEALEEWQQIANGTRRNARELFSADARDLSSSPLLDAIVTSPPYINAIDYVWASKFELHWLGMVVSDEDRLSLYTREIGTERIPRKVCKELGRTGNTELDYLVEEIYLGKKYQASKGQNALRARVVYQYFMDMRQHFLNSFNCLRPGGYYCFTVGDTSKICGVDIPVAKFLTHFACQVGFEKIFNFHILLKNRKLNVPRNVTWAGTIKHDTTVVLRKPVL